MKNLKGCYSHKSDEWATPTDIYKSFIKNGYMDPCPMNHKEDGLKIEWGTKAFVNPPYSQIGKWIDKAIEEKEKGKFIVLLVPARTDTKWFRKLFEEGAEIYLIQGRLHFNDAKQGAPFPSAIIALRKGYKKCPMIDYWN